MPVAVTVDNFLLLQFKIIIFYPYGANFSDICAYRLKLLPSVVKRLLFIGE